jgi:hypothetical protein
LFFAESIVLSAGDAPDRPDAAAHQRAFTPSIPVIEDTLSHEQ